MPTSIFPGGGTRPGRVARWAEAIRTLDPARLRRAARRSWSRLLISTCLAEARRRPESLRVRPPPATPSHHVEAAAGPLDGPPEPFALLARQLGLHQPPAGSIANRAIVRLSAPIDQGPAPAGPGRREEAARRQPGRPNRASRPDRPIRSRPVRPPAGPIPGLKRRGPRNPDHQPARAHAEAEQRAGDIGEALILAAGLAGAGLGGSLLGWFGACLGLLAGIMLGGTYVERPRDDGW